MERSGNHSVKAQGVGERRRLFRPGPGWPERRFAHSATLLSMRQPAQMEFLNMDESVDSVEAIVAVITEAANEIEHATGR